MPDAGKQRVHGLNNGFLWIYRESQAGKAAARRCFEDSEREIVLGLCVVIHAPGLMAELPRKVKLCA